MVRQKCSGIRRSYLVAVIALTTGQRCQNKNPTCRGNRTIHPALNAVGFFIALANIFSSATPNVVGIHCGFAINPHFSEATALSRLTG